MKKLTVLFMFVAILFSGCKKDDSDVDPNALNPTAKQKGFALEWTSTTCSICGATGGPLLHKYAKDAANSVCIALHCNGSSDFMANNTMQLGFQNDRPSGGGIPSFWVGNQKTQTSNQTAMLDLVATGDAVAGVDLTYSVSGTTMTVNTLTKFFSAATGDYYLSVYVLEDGINGSSTAPTGYVQTGGGANYIHDFVIRAAANNQVMGQSIGLSFTANQEIAKNYTITLDPTWKKVYAVAVLWKYVSSASPKYQYVNAMRR